MAKTRLDKNRGWFQVPGIKPLGDRSLSEQMIGLEFALIEAKGKTVLDIGCAEALITLEFAKAGAAKVVGIEKVAPAIALGRTLCAGYPQVELMECNLVKHIDANPSPQQFDIVLALGIAHKPKDPAAALCWAARSASSLLVFRPPGYEVDGWFKSKHSDNVCHGPSILTGEGFVQERRIEGAHGEHVEYWRRQSRP
jgi:SAM-dependent methyltransferase